MRMTSVTVMVIFLKMLLWNLLDCNYAQSSFSTIMRNVNIGIERHLTVEDFMVIDQNTC